METVLKIALIGAPFYAFAFLMHWLQGHRQDRRRLVAEILPLIDAKLNKGSLHTFSVLYPDFSIKSLHSFLAFLKEMPDVEWAFSIDPSDRKGCFYLCCGTSRGSGSIFFEGNTITYLGARNGERAFAGNLTSLSTDVRNYFHLN